MFKNTISDAQLCLSVIWSILRERGGGEKRERKCERRRVTKSFQCVCVCVLQREGERESKQERKKDKAYKLFVREGESVRVSVRA